MWLCKCAGNARSFDNSFVRIKEAANQKLNKICDQMPIQTDLSKGSVFGRYKVSISGTYTKYQLRNRQQIGNDWEALCVLNFKASNQPAGMLWIWICGPTRSGANRKLHWSHLEFLDYSSNRKKTRQRAAARKIGLMVDSCWKQQFTWAKKG